MNVKYVLFNTVKELPVRLEEIEFKTKFDKFINQIQKEFMNQIVKTNNIFSTCNGILMYGRPVVIPAVLTKKNLKDFHTRAPGVWVEWRLSCRVMYPGRVWIKTLKTRWDSIHGSRQTNSGLVYILIMPVRNILFYHSWQLYEMVRSFQMQNASD